MTEVPFKIGDSGTKENNQEQLRELQRAKEDLRHFLEDPATHPEGALSAMAAARKTGLSEIAHSLGRAAVKAMVLAIQKAIEIVGDENPDDALDSAWLSDFKVDTYTQHTARHVRYQMEDKSIDFADSPTIEKFLSALRRLDVAIHWVTFDYRRGISATEDDPELKDDHDKFVLAREQELETRLGPYDEERKARARELGKILRDAFTRFTEEVKDTAEWNIDINLDETVAQANAVIDAKILELTPTQ